MLYTNVELILASLFKVFREESGNRFLEKKNFSVGIGNKGQSSKQACRGNYFEFSSTKFFSENVCLHLVDCTNTWVLFAKIGQI